MSEMAAIYYRTSSPGQRDRQTIELQKAVLPEWVKKQGWAVFTEYCDDGKTGTSIGAREDFQRFLRDAEARRFTALVVIEHDRITRAEDPGERGLILSTLWRNGIKLASPYEGILDLRENPSHELIAQIKLWGAAEERKKQLRRQYEGKLRRLQENGWIGHGLPYGIGWNRETRRFEQVPHEARVVREMVRLYLEDHLSLEKLAAALNAKGYITRKGGRWTDASIHAILRNPAIAGTLRVHTREGVKDLTVPAIVDEATFATLQAQLAARRAWSERNTKNQYLCAKLLRCALCGAKLIGETLRGRKPHHARHSYYVCYNHHAPKKTGRFCPLPLQKASVIDELVWQTIAALLQRPEVLRDALAGPGGNTGQDLEAERADLEARLKANWEEQNRITRLYRKGKLSEALVESQLREVEADRRILEAARAEVERKARQAAVAHERLQTVDERLRPLRDRITTLSFEERRELVRLLVPGDRTYYIEIAPDRPPLVKGVLDFDRLPRGGDTDREVIKVHPGSRSRLETDYKPFTFQLVAAGRALL